MTFKEKQELKRKLEDQAKTIIQEALARCRSLGVKVSFEDDGGADTTIYEWNLNYAVDLRKASK